MNIDYILVNVIDPIGAMIPDKNEFLGKSPTNIQ